jgi:tetratricopeptide (TPR) repeat protein
LEPFRFAWLLDADSREKADAYKRALEVARREKLRQLDERMQTAAMPGGESKAFALIADMLDLKPTNREELITILGKLRGRMAASDLEVASAKLVEARRTRIERLDALGLFPDAAVVVANLELCQSPSTVGTIEGLKNGIVKNGRNLRDRLEAQAAAQRSQGAFGEAFRSLLQLLNAFPNDPEIAKDVELARKEAVARVSLTHKERLFVRRLYFLAAIQYANRNNDEAKDLLREILRRNPADTAASDLEDAMLRSDVVEDRLQ